MRKGDREIISNHRVDPELVYERPGREYHIASMRRQMFTALCMHVTDELINKRDPDWESRRSVLLIDICYCLDRSF